MPKQKLMPLPQTAFQILISLAEEDLHGYAIMRRVEAQTEGKVRIGPGTLYSSIQTLVDAGLIIELEGKPETSDERRRCYRLTPEGRNAAREEAQRLADLLRTARKHNILRGDYV